ncbi:hypothetical protein Esti_001390 [Eimeria stiedai]
MDVDLALVSALQLRELLQQHSPSSPQVQELASQCEKLLEVARDILKVKGADPKVEQAWHDLTEALVFFRSIAAADEDLAQNKQEQQEPSAVDSAWPRCAERTGSDSGKKHRHASSTSSKRRKNDKDDVAHRSESHSAVHDNLETLFSDWPHADLLDTGPDTGVAASSSPPHQSYSWGEGKADDAFASANSSSAAAATGAGTVPQGEPAAHRRRGADRGSKARGKGCRTARQAVHDVSSSETSSSSLSRSTSTRSRDSRDSTLSNRRHGHWKEKRRSHQRHAASAEVSLSAPHTSSIVELKAAGDWCCCLCVASLRASLHLPSSRNSFRLAVELDVPSYNVEGVEEGAPVADGVGSINNGSFQGVVTWDHRVSFLIKTTRKKSRRHRDGSSPASKAVHALQQQGQMRFLISCPEDKGPCLVGDFALHSTAREETTFHQVPLHYTSQSTFSSGGTECGFLFFSIQVDVVSTARVATNVAGTSHPSSTSGPTALISHDRDAGDKEGHTSRQLRSRAAGDPGATRDSDLVARCEAAQKESAALHQQNGALQAHIQEQQQVLMQQHHQLQLLHAQVQQMNANLNDAFQRLTAYEAQCQQQLHTLHQVQQQRDAAAANAAAEKAKLQREMLQVEDDLEAAREEEKRLQELVRKHKKEADQLDRELQQEVGRRKAAENKAEKQDQRIAELTTLLNNARSRIRHERQRTGDLVVKLEGRAMKTNFHEKASTHTSAAADGQHQLLSLTWGLDSPPFFSGLPASLTKGDEEERDPWNSSQRKQQAHARIHSPSDPEQAQSESVRTSRQPATHALSLVAATPLWSDPIILRRVIPPSQLSEKGGNALLLALQEGYTALMQTEVDFSEKAVKGVLLDTSFLRVEWCSSIHGGCGSGTPHDSPSHLSGAVAATALFAISVTSDISAVPVITVTLEQEVFEGGRIMLAGRPSQQPRGLYVCGQLEASRPSRDAPILLINVLTSDSLTQSFRLKLPLPAAAFCGPSPLTGEAFSLQWRSLEMQEDAVLVDLSLSHLRSAVSLLALGGRFAVLPVSEEADARSRDARRAGTTCIHASSVFPRMDANTRGLRRSRVQQCIEGFEDDFALKEARILCLVELAVRQNASSMAPQHSSALRYRAREPNGALRVRCRDTALRCSVLEALLQQLITPQQLLDAAETTVAHKRR